MIDWKIFLFYALFGFHSRCLAMYCCFVFLFFSFLVLSVYSYGPVYYDNVVFFHYQQIQQFHPIGNVFFVFVLFLLFFCLLHFTSFHSHLNRIKSNQLWNNLMHIFQKDFPKGDIFCCCCCCCFGVSKRVNFGWEKKL